MIDLHHGRARFIGRTAAVGLILVAVVALLFAISAKDEVQVGGKTEAYVPCREEFQNQQLALQFPEKPDQGSGDLTLSSSIMVGTTGESICVNSDTEFSNEEWAIDTIRLYVSSLSGDEGHSEPVTYSKTANAETEYLPLYAPIDGCVRVTGEIRAVQTPGPGTGGPQYATWRVEGIYGEDCLQARGNSV